MSHLSGTESAKRGHSVCKSLDTVTSVIGRETCPELGRMLLEVKLQQPAEGKSPSAWDPQQPEHLPVILLRLKT